MGALIPLSVYGAIRNFVRRQSLPRAKGASRAFTSTRKTGKPTYGIGRFPCFTTIRLTSGDRFPFPSSRERISPPSTRRQVRPRKILWPDRTDPSALSGGLSKLAASVIPGHHPLRTLARPSSFEAGQEGFGEVFMRRFCRKRPSKLLLLFPPFLPASVQEARKKFFAAGKRRVSSFPFSGRSALSFHGTNWNSAPPGTVSLGAALFWASRYFGGTLRAGPGPPAPAGCRRRCRERSSRRPARTRPLPSAPSRRAWRFSSRDPAFPGSFRRL